MPILKRKRVLAAKIETTIGTAESLTGSEGAFNVYNPMIQANIDMEDREGQGGFGRLTSVPGGRLGTATFRTNIEWDGTATEPSWADTFFPACGWVKSTNTYYPTTEAPGSNVKTLTIGLYCGNDGASNGPYKVLAGCTGNFKVTLVSGKLAYIDWTFQGVWQAVTDAAIIAPTYPTDSALRYAGGFAEWNDVNLCVESCTIDSGNTITPRECPTTASGYISTIITDRAPKITCNPEAVKIATQDRWGLWLSQGVYELEMSLDGPTTSTLEFSAPKAQILNLQEGDRNKMVTDELEFLCTKNGATQDQELSIIFTPAV